MNSDFCFYFCCNDKQSKEDGFCNLRLFSAFVGRYRQNQRQGEVSDLVAKFDSLIELHNRSEANFRRLLGWLDDMASLDSGYSDDEYEDCFGESDGFETWRGVADSFENFLGCEIEFLEALSKHSPAPARPPPD